MKDIVSNLFHCWTAEEIRGLFVLVTFFGILIGLATFIIERFISKRNRKRENKKSWLIEIIISPEIENINSYFLDAVDSFDKQIEEIGLIEKSQEGILQDEINKRSQFINEFSITNKLFINTFVALIEEYDLKVGQNLKGLISDLKDTYTEILGNFEIDLETAKFQFNQRCNIIKAKFYYELFKIVI